MPSKPDSISSPAREAKATSSPAPSPQVSLQSSSPGGGPSGFPGITGLSSLTDVKAKVQAGHPVRHALPLTLQQPSLRASWPPVSAPSHLSNPLTLRPESWLLTHIQRPLPASTCLLSHCSLSPLLPPKVQSFRLWPCHSFHQKALSEGHSKAS